MLVTGSGIVIGSRKKCSPFLNNQEKYILVFSLEGEVPTSLWGYGSKEGGATTQRKFSGDNLKAPPPSLY